MHLPNSYRRQLRRSKSDSDLFKSSSRKVPTIGKSLSDIEKEEVKTITMRYLLLIQFFNVDTMY